LPLVNREYLNSQEVKLKKRFIVELLENLVLEFPELCYDLRIKPEYFLHETLMDRARLFPLMTYRLQTFTSKGNYERNVINALQGYLQALTELQHEGMISSSDGFIKVSEKFANTLKQRKISFVNILKTAKRAQRSLFMSWLGVFPEILANLSRNRELRFTLRHFAWRSKAFSQVEDPHNFLFVPTSHGPIPLADRTDIEAVMRRAFSAKNGARIDIRRIGGVLNDVYIATLASDNEERKAIVKRYRDWSNFKWFPLTLWTVGTRTFAVLGSSRLEKEVAINRLLDSKHFRVPKILHVSPSQRLVFMEHVKGEDVSTIVRRIAVSKIPSRVKKDLNTLSRVGRKLAKVHALGISLGDTKPENFMIGEHGEIIMMDFEQASRSGDRVWDVAEFLYYSGHDLPPFVDIHRAELIAQSFLSGYLDAGGSVDVVKTAATTKYTKVFSVFTLPNIMLTLSNVCRKADRLKG
jgi:tRNA A-37 threonylcarbamoyl transferase component Bud32